MRPERQNFTGLEVYEAEKGEKLCNREEYILIIV